jgi:FAD/FMN-containing dehydrogenase
MTLFRKTADILAWGRVHRFEHSLAAPAHADAVAGLIAGVPAEYSVLGRGMGRSYGDSGLNGGQYLIEGRGLDRVITFDRETGVLEAEAGLTLAGILRLLTNDTGRGLPLWFLPVTPGTKFVTLGGAVANDVHGKNHHSAGCFGNHILRLSLLRSDGSVAFCSPEQNAELFRATIGGLGLTGFILSVAIQLKSVPGFWLEGEDIRYDSLDDFHKLAEESENAWEYTVAWIDCLAGGASLGRGIFSRSRHAPTLPGRPTAGRTAFEPALSMPVEFPNFALNNLSIRAFNAAYWRHAGRRPRLRPVTFDTAFYPLDAIGRWNRMYGPRGFFQYQCAVPRASSADAVRELLRVIASAGRGSFLAVLKTLGDRASPGLMSFPLPGATLALDFPNDGAPTTALFERLDAIVAEAGGRLYAAKDGRGPAGLFHSGYPNLDAFAKHIDPRFSSSFWRRVGAPVPEPRS